MILLDASWHAAAVGVQCRQSLEPSNLDLGVRGFFDIQPWRVYWKAFPHEEIDEKAEPWLDFTIYNSWDARLRSGESGIHDDNCPEMKPHLKKPKKVKAFETANKVKA